MSGLSLTIRIKLRPSDLIIVVSLSDYSAEAATFPQHGLFVYGFMEEGGLSMEVKLNVSVLLFCLTYAYNCYFFVDFNVIYQ